LELRGGFDVVDRGAARNLNLNVNRDQRSKSEDPNFAKASLGKPRTTNEDEDN
jgi:hypothetical protein